MTLSSRLLISQVRPLLIAVTMVTLLTACGGTDDMAAPPRAPDFAVTANGSVQAMDRVGMRSYYGIPFAAPPVADLRWQPPQAPAKWTIPLAKTQPAAPCLQTSASPFRLANDTEDCLYLDVHAPTGDGPFPVMVWMHGGAFNTGGVTTYNDPSPLVTKGVIVVPIPYRLGAMGFLGHPTLEAADTSVGNYGIMDQQAALAWVRDNIAVFGGDPKNVTIFGESAGGFSVLTHLASPLSTGLFHKAIIQSGAYGVNGQLTKATLETRSATVVDLAIGDAITASVTVGCTPGNVTAACLRSLPDSVVRTQLATRFNASMASPAPSVDGKVLPKTIKQTFIDGGNNKVPVINGTNENEYTLFVAIGELGRRNVPPPLNTDPTNLTFSSTAANYPLNVAGLALGTGGATAALTGTHYPLANFGANVLLQPSLGLSALGTDVIFACNGLNVSNRVRQQASPIFAYEFRDQTAIPSLGRDANDNYFLSFPQGAAHSYEIQYLFNFTGRPAKNAEQAALGTAMSTYWTNFARGGNPNGTGVVQWADFSTNAVLGLDVAAGGGVAPLASTAFATAHKCDTVWSVLTF